MTGDDLVMELTHEMGPGRETQVQPPLGAWVTYFRIDPDSIDPDNPPRLRLTNAQDLTEGAKVRPVVEHHHTLTVEVSGVQPPHGSIIRFRRTDADAYLYWVYRPGDPDFGHCRWILDIFENPYHHRGRKWIVI